MLPDLKFRISAENATATAFANVRGEVKATETAFAAAARQAKLLMGAVGATVGIAGITMLARSAREAIGTVGDLNDAADRAGVSAEKLQLLRFALEQTAGSAEDADSALQKFGVSVGQASLKNGGAAADAFTALGVSIRDVSGNVRDSEPLFDEVIAKLGGVENPAQRAAVATALFGRQAGPELSALASQGANGLATFSGQLDRVGKLSNDTVSRGDELDNWFKRISGSVENLFTQAIVDAGSSLYYFVDAMQAVENRNFLAGLGLDLDKVHAQLDSTIDQMIELKQQLANPAQASMVGHTLLQTEIKDLDDKVKALHQEEARIIARMAELNVQNHPAFQRTLLPPPANGGGGGGGSRVSDDGAAIIDVYAALKQQRDALTMTNREQAIANQLAAAHVTAASADGIEIARQTGLIYDQQQAMDALNQAAGFAGDAIYSAFDSLIFQGDSVNDVLANVVKSLAQAALQAELLGKARIGGMFGSDAVEEDGLLDEAEDDDEGPPLRECPAAPGEAAPAEAWA